MDCTIISISPFTTEERKPLVNGFYKIPGAKKGDIVTFLVRDSYYNLPMAGTMPPKSVQVPVYGEHIAASIIKDFCLTHVAAEPGAHPGMMWAKGNIDSDTAKKKYPVELQALQVIQTRWFENLVKSADDDWERYRQHRLINEHQRYAAEALGITDREWCKSFNPNAGMVTCPACFTQVNPEASLCFNCKAVLNEAKIKQQGIKFAQIGA